MAASRRKGNKDFYTAEEALNIIFQSEHEVSSDGSENEFLPQKEVSSSSSDSDDYQDSEDESTRLASTSSDIQASTSTDRNTIITRHGIAWEPLSSSRKGRYSQSQVFKATSGISKTVKNVAAESPYSAWRIFIDETMLRKIHKYTINEGKNHDESWVLSLEKFEAYIALTYARGVYGKAHSTDFLWNKTYGPKIFGETMSRSDYKKILRFIRFDNRSTRSERIKSDKFTHIREIFDLFVENCRGAYIPTYSLTIDEQLLPMKNRCPFIVFMPNKPDKFGMKFWVLTEVENKYIVNVIPYLGAIEKESRLGVPLAEHVVLSLTEVVKNKGYNVTTDNFFTSLEVARKLRDRATSIVGTVRGNSKHLSKEMTLQEKGKKYESKFYFQDESECMFVNYQCKANKNVCLLSTMHSSPTISEGEKKKPAVIDFYNANKVGVDVVDQMLRMYSTRCATRRWPLGVFCNILDMAVINGWIIYKLASGRTISRKEFILELIESLRHAYVQKRSLPNLADVPSTSSSLLKKRRKCHGIKCSNATITVCQVCKKPTCGKCAKDETRVVFVTCKDCGI